MKKYQKIILFLIIIGLAAFAALFFVSTAIIGKSVYQKCEYAQTKYEGDCVEALIAFLQDDVQNYSNERNSAIWALGQLGDSRALPVLKEYYTGYTKGKREGLSDGLSQYELYKAIKLLEGAFNAGAWVWR